LPFMSSLPAPAASPHAPQLAALARQHRRLAALGETPWLHEEIARRLADKLDPILLTPTEWLDWSGHLGGSTQAIEQRYPHARRWVMETDEALARQAIEHWQSAHAKPWWAAWKKNAPAPVLRHAGEQPEAWPADGVDMLWANMSLHNHGDVDAQMAQWHTALKTGGFVMCSGLGPDTARELRSVYAAMGWGLPTVKFIDMHDLGDAMVQAGFADPVMDMEQITLTWADAHAMLRECRTWGGNVALGRFQGCRTPRWKERLVLALQEALRRPDGRLGLTIEVVYGHAIKPLPRVPVAAESRVSLGDMRKMIKGQGR
jgi:malonyl-CoA O-methyltransferase